MCREMICNYVHNRENKEITKHALCTNLSPALRLDINNSPLLKYFKKCHVHDLLFEFISFRLLIIKIFNDFLLT